jgi:hypothetical protein
MRILGGCADRNRKSGNHVVITDGGKAVPCTQHN